MIELSDSDIRLLMYSPLSLRMGAGGDRWLVEVAPRLRERGIHPTVFATDFIAKSYRANPTNWFVDQIVDAEIRIRLLMQRFGTMRPHRVESQTR
jgi:hypothetical protein